MEEGEKQTTGMKRERRAEKERQGGSERNGSGWGANKRRRRKTKKRSTRTGKDQLENRWWQRVRAFF